MKQIYITQFICFMIIALFVFGISSGFVFAQDEQGFKNPLGNNINSIIGFFEVVLTEIVVPIGAVVVAFFIIWSGFLFVTAGGSEDKIRTARTTFVYTMIGAAVLLGAWALTEAIAATVCAIAGEGGNIPGLCGNESS